LATTPAVPFRRKEPLPFRSRLAETATRQNTLELQQQQRRDAIVDPPVHSLTALGRNQGVTADQQQALQQAINLFHLSSTEAVLEAVELGNMSAKFFT
jgi:hypothetical protein